MSTSNSQDCNSMFSFLKQTKNKYRFKMKIIAIVCSLAAVLFSSCKKEECEIPVQPESIKTPAAINITSFTLFGFNALKIDGEYWDSATNLPDPFVEFYNDESLVYRSDVIGSANSQAIYELNTPAVGVLPVSLPASSYGTIVLLDSDGTNVFEEMARIVIQARYFYNSDNAASFENVEIFGNNGLSMRLSGNFIY